MPRKATWGMPSKEGFIWRDAFLYQCDLRAWSTNHALCSKCDAIINGQMCMSNSHDKYVPTLAYVLSFSLKINLFYNQNQL